MTGVGLFPAPAPAPSGDQPPLWGPLKLEASRAFLSTGAGATTRRPGQAQARPPGRLGFPTTEGSRGLLAVRGRVVLPPPPGSLRGSLTHHLQMGPTGQVQMADQPETPGALGWDRGSGFMALPLPLYPSGPSSTSREKAAHRPSADPASLSSPPGSPERPRRLLLSGY